MRLFERTFDSPHVMETIGIDGEANSVIIRVDVKRWVRRYPDARFAVVVRRPDGYTYPAAQGIVAERDGTVEYLLHRDDLAQSGKLRIEFQMHSGAALIKSFSWSFYISRCLSTMSGARPTDPPDWVDRVLAESSTVMRVAEKMNNLKVKAVTVPYGEQPTASFEEEDRAYLLRLGIPQADQIEGAQIDSDGKLTLELTNGGAVNAGYIFQPITSREIQQIVREVFSS